MLHIGSLAPDFCLLSNNGEKLSLTNFKDKNIVLYFYPKNDTPACTQEAKDFQNNLSNFSALNTVIIGISPDSFESHCNFQKKYNLNLVLLSDTESNVAKLYGAWGEKTMFGKSYMGALRTTFLINEKGIITNIWYNVKVEGHIVEVLNVLTSTP